MKRLLLAASVLLWSTTLTQGQSALSPASQPATRPADVVTLKSGERVVGRILERSDDHVTINSRLLGRVTIAGGDVASVFDPLVDGPATRPSDVAVADTGAAQLTPVSPISAAAAAPVDDRGLFGTGILKGWARQVELGVSGATGNTDAVSINTQANASYESTAWRSTLGASYFLDKSGGTTGRNQTRLFGTADRRFGDGPYFLWSRGEYDNDSLIQLQNRISAYAGPGYEFVKNDKYTLLGRVGLGYTDEFGGHAADGYDEGRLEALVGLDGKWVINPTSSIVASIYYTPSLESFGEEGRIVTTIAYQADFASYRGLAFKAGIEHDYELKTPGDDEHSDFKYFANLVYKL